MAGTLADDGKVLSPVGAPDATLFAVPEPGRALIELFTGDPWHEPRRTTVTVEVRAAASRRMNRAVVSQSPNVGDQQSDLDGGFAEKAFRVPNPFYFIP
jgi:hypothetical protein